MSTRFDYSWVILTVSFVVLFFGGGSRFAFGLMLKPMADDLELSRSTLSLAVTSFMVVSAITTPLVGHLVDQGSLRLTIAVAAVGAATGIGLMSLVNASWHVFLLYGLIFAAGNSGMSITPVGVMISRWFTQRRGLANSVAVSGSAVGQLAIVALLTTILISVGWRATYVILGVANLAIVVPVVLTTAKASPHSPTDEENAVRTSQGMDRYAARVTDPGAEVANGVVPLNKILASRQFWLLLIVYSACGFQDFLVATHIVAFATDQGLGPVLAGNLLALMGLTGLIGVILSGFLADAFGATRPTALCFLLRVGGFASIIYMQSKVGIVAFALLYGFTFLTTAPLTVLFAEKMFGSASLGTVSGLITMGHHSAGGLGAFVGALIFDQWGSYNGAFALLLGLSILAAVITSMVSEKPLGTGGADSTVHMSAKGHP